MIEIFDTRDGMYNQMKDNEILKAGKYPMFVFKLLDLQKGYELQEDEMMVQILDNIICDVWDYVNDIRPDLGFKSPNGDKK